MCLAKIIQRALFLGICNGPLAILREHGLPESQKDLIPRTMDASMTTPLIIKSGPNYA